MVYEGALRLKFSRTLSWSEASFWCLGILECPHAACTAQQCMPHTRPKDHRGWLGAGSMGEKLGPDNSWGSRTGGGQGRAGQGSRKSRNGPTRCSDGCRWVLSWVCSIGQFEATMQPNPSPNLRPRPQPNPGPVYPHPRCRLPVTSTAPMPLHQTLPHIWPLLR